jgi:hypothetical protein
MLSYWIPKIEATCESEDFKAKWVGNVGSMAYTGFSSAPVGLILAIFI